MFTKSFGLAVEYNNTWHKSYETFFDTKQYSDGNNMFDYNHAKQLQNSISLSFIKNTRKNIALNLSAGYNFNNDIFLYNNKTKLTSASGKNDFFFGVQLNYLIMH